MPAWLNAGRPTIASAPARNLDRASDALFERLPTPTGEGLGGYAAAALAAGVGCVGRDAARLGLIRSERRVLNLRGPGYWPVAMSQENVERFRRGADALERGGVDVALLDELIHPDVIFEPLRAPVSGTYRGHDGIRQFIADTAASFDVFRFVRSDIRDLGDRVLAIGTLHIRARKGGIETDVPTAGIATYRDGRLVHWKDYGDRERALEAAGLRE